MFAQLFKVKVGVKLMPHDYWVGVYRFPFFAVPMQGDLVRFSSGKVYRCVSRRIDSNKIANDVKVWIWAEEVKA